MNVRRKDTLGHSTHPSRSQEGCYWYHGWGKNWTKPHGIRKKNRWSNMQKDVWVRYLAGWFEPLELNHNRTTKRQTQHHETTGHGEEETVVKVVFGATAIVFCWVFFECVRLRQFKVQSHPARTIRDVGLTMFVWRLSSIYLNDKLPQKVCGLKIHVNLELGFLGFKYGGYSNRSPPPLQMKYLGGGYHRNFCEIFHLEHEISPPPLHTFRQSPRMLGGVSQRWNSWIFPRQATAKALSKDAFID